MARLLLVLALLGGCASTPPSRATDAPSALVDEGMSLVPLARLVGTWAEGQERLIITSEQTYHWERERECGVPPCAIEQRSGSFERKPGRLLFATVSGPPLPLTFELASDPRRITVRLPNGQQWTLPFVE